MITGSDNITRSINGFLDECDKGSKRKVSWFFRGLKKICGGLGRMTKYNVAAGYWKHKTEL